MFGNTPPPRSEIPEPSLPHSTQVIVVCVLVWRQQMGVTSAWSPLGNFLEGQVHPNLSLNQVFLFFWREVFCVCFPVVKGFSNNFQFKFFIYSLYIHMYIFYRFFHCTHSFVFLCLQWFLFGILVMDGMSERNHCHIIIFSLYCFKGLSVASWRIMQHVIEKPLPYN